MVLQSETVITKRDRKQLSKIYFKVWQKLQSTSGIAKWDRSLLESVKAVITKCVRYYKEWQLLKSER